MNTDIKGLGTDIVETARISAMVEKYAGSFLRRIYTPAEIEFCKGKALPGVHFAGRWAVKEAFYKALPASVQPFSSWKSIQVLSGERSRPCIDVCDERLREALSTVGVSSIHLSLSHERAFCVAVVVLQ